MTCRKSLYRLSVRATTFHSSSPYTPRVMTIAAMILVPVVLVYQTWTYWVFRKRVEIRPKKLTY